MAGKVVCFDVDGTLSDAEHRRHFLAVKPKNWNAFLSGATHDAPHTDIVWLLNVLYDAGCTILITTARGAEYRGITTTWLEENGVRYHGIYFRPERDYRADNIVKKEILDEITNTHGKPYMVFDDRDQVCKMWRENGVRCLQVAPGDF